MILRIATSEDRNELNKLLNKLDEENPLPAGKKERFSKMKMPGEDGFLAVAAENDGLFAFVSANGEDCDVMLGIDLAHQNRGIAKMLFAMLEDWAFENRIETAHATIHSGSYLPLHVFARHGFEGAKRDGEMLTLTKVFSDQPRYVKPVVEANELLNWAFID